MPDKSGQHARERDLSLERQSEHSGSPTWTQATRVARFSRHRNATSSTVACSGSASPARVAGCPGVRIYHKTTPHTRAQIKESAGCIKEMARLTTERWVLQCCDYLTPSTSREAVQLRRRRHCQMMKRQTEDEDDAITYAEGELSSDSSASGPATTTRFTCVRNLLDSHPPAMHLNSFAHV